MSETITLQALDLSGETLTMFLRKSDGTLLNTGGDAMTESGSTGVFTATLAESRSGLGPLAVRICSGGETADNLLYDGFLVEGTTVIDSIVRAELDSAVQTQITAIETFATRMTTGLVVDGAVYQFTANMLELGPSGGGGGDATLAKQTEILAAIQGSEVIQVASPNVSGNLVLTQGDDYDGVANPKASWTVTTDYTSGWTVRLTIRSATDAVIYTNTGSVVSSTVVAVTIAAPTGLTMTGCPGQWQGKFDVELTHSSGKKKTIALGTCYINEDQTR
jgi:hypothetical protein